MPFESEWQPALELDGEPIEGLFPVLDRHRPLFRGLLDGQVHHFQRRAVAGENAAVVDGLANHAVERLDGVGRVDDPPDVRGVVITR